MIFLGEENVTAALTYTRRAVELGWWRWDTMTNRLHVRYLVRREREQYAEGWAQNTNLAPPKEHSLPAVNDECDTGKGLEQKKPRFLCDQPGEDEDGGGNDTEEPNPDQVEGQAVSPAAAGGPASAARSASAGSSASAAGPLKVEQEGVKEGEAPTPGKEGEQEEEKGKGRRGRGGKGTGKGSKGKGGKVEKTGLERLLYEAGQVRATWKAVRIQYQDLKGLVLLPEWSWMADGPDLREVDSFVTKLEDEIRSKAWDTQYFLVTGNDKAIAASDDHSGELQGHLQAVKNYGAQVDQINNAIKRLHRMQKARA